MSLTREISTLPPITERDFAQQVVELAQLRGWEVYRTWNSIHSPGGFPDLVMVRPPYLIFAELKREGKEPTVAQEKWLEALRKCESSPYLSVAVWHPSDWAEIEQRLR